MGEAAREICAIFHASAPAGPMVSDVYTWKRDRLQQLRRVIQAADYCTGQFSVASMDEAWSDRLFAAAILAKAQAINLIEELDTADERELQRMMNGKDGRKDGRYCGLRGP